MATDLIARFSDPVTTARYLGESIGTHYSVALRAAKAYGVHLAARRDSLVSGSYEGEELGDFWRDLLRSENVRMGSTEVMKGLSTTPAHYFSDFLDTADAVFKNKYSDVPLNRRKTSTKTEHAKCLRYLRDHRQEGRADHFSVQNNVATWTQLSRMLGQYQE